MNRRRLLPKLRTLLLLANLTALLLPIGGIVLLNLYESELVRQTESALIGQGALLAATFRQEILRRAENHDTFIAAKPTVPHSQFSRTDSLTPIRPQLDVAKAKILPPAPDAMSPNGPPEPITLAAGRTLSPILGDAQRITLAGIRLVDHRGTVVASSGSEFGLSLSNRSEVKGALQGSYVSLLRQRISDDPTPTITSMSRKAWLRVFVALPVLDKDKVLGAVVLSRSPIGVGRGLYMIRNHLLKATVVLLLLVFVVSLTTTLAITRPIKALIRQADKVRSGEKEAAEVLTHPGTQEVAQLSQSIAQMATSLAARADYIRTFAQNVSHEFKTPLASLKGSVELLNDHGDTMTKEERQKFLGNMEIDIDGLTRMVHRLLELARADVIRPGPASCSGRGVSDQLQKRYIEKNVHFTIEDDLPKVHMNPEVLQSILANLIDNALQHGGEATKVNVSGKKTEGGRIEWLIHDNGAGITEANAQKIFRPFFSTARHRGGTGLGLSIVQSLLLAHGGSIELLPSEEGASFRVVT